MHKLTIKNVPALLYRALKTASIQHRRSLNNEIIESLAKVYISHKINPEEFLVRVRQLRKTIKGNISISEIITAIRSCRS